MYIHLYIKRSINCQVRTILLAVIGMVVIAVQALANRRPMVVAAIHMHVETLRIPKVFLAFLVKMVAMAFAMTEIQM